MRGYPSRPKGQDLRSCDVSLRGFESLPPQKILKKLITLGAEPKSILFTFLVLFQRNLPITRIFNPHH